MAVARKVQVWQSGTSHDQVKMKLENDDGDAILGYLLMSMLSRNHHDPHKITNKNQEIKLARANDTAIRIGGNSSAKQNPIPLCGMVMSSWLCQSISELTPRPRSARRGGPVPSLSEREGSVGQS